jgi:HEAT repeat protein
MSWLDIVCALGSIGDSRALDSLFSLLKAKNLRFIFNEFHLRERFKTDIVLALSECGKQAIPALVSDLLQSRVHEVALALEKLQWKPKTNEEQLSYALARTAWAEAAGVGTSAVEALLHELKCNIKDGRWIIGCLGNGDVDYRDTYRIVAIVNALGSIRDTRVVDVLMQILSADLNKHSLWNSGNHLIFEAVANALGCIGELAIKPLESQIAKVGFVNAEGRQAAERALALCKKGT